MKPPLFLTNTFNVKLISFEFDCWGKHTNVSIYVCMFPTSTVQSYVSCRNIFHPSQNQQNYRRFVFPRIFRTGPCNIFCNNYSDFLALKDILLFYSGEKTFTVEPVQYVVSSSVFPIFLTSIISLIFLLSFSVLRCPSPVFPISF